MGADGNSATSKRLGRTTLYFRRSGTSRTRSGKCSSCHNVHGTENPALLIKPANVICLECHGPESPNGPHTATIEAHTHHKAGTEGNDCISCHMPKVEQTIADVNVRSHTFEFISPTLTQAFQIPNPCTTCHKDKSPEWALSELKAWKSVSPWRAGR